MLVNIVCFFCSEGAVISPLATEKHMLIMLYAWGSTEFSFLFCSKPHQCEMYKESARTETERGVEPRYILNRSLSHTLSFMVNFLSFFSHSYLVPLSHTKSCLPSDCVHKSVSGLAFRTEVFQCICTLYFHENLFSWFDLCCWLWKTDFT